jgi:D-psicose/D-tagatose/L-ribulose 3-epimerase
MAATALPTILSAAGNQRAKLAICSETFAGLSFPKAAGEAANIGYKGIEIQPDHLSSEPANLSANERNAIRNVLRECQLSFVGLHAFLKAPASLQLVSNDAELRRKSWSVFSAMVELAADFADNSKERPILAFGSGKQRMQVGVSKTEALARLADGLAAVARVAEARKVQVLLEPLAPHLCPIVNTLDEAMVLVRRVNSPAIQTMFDTHNTVAETLPVDTLLRRHIKSIRHVHFNEMDGRYPGAGDYTFSTVLRALQQLNYKGWLSVEVFDFKPDGVTVARRAFEHLDRQLNPNSASKLSKEASL